MGPLGRTAARSVGVAFVGVGLLAASGALVRVLPWLVDPRVSFATVLVFFRGLLSAGVEVSGLVALPMGFSLAAASFSDRGEARACFLSGASPSGLVRRAWPVLLTGAALTGAASAYVAREATAPARVLNGLVQAARAGCDANHRPVAEVPGTLAAWLCAPSAPPELTVVIEGSAVVRATSLTLADDLRLATLRDARFDLRGPPIVRLDVAEATITGLSGFAAPSGLDALPRLLASGIGAAVSAFAVATSLLARREGRRTVALGLAGACSIAMLAALRVAESAHAGYLTVAVVVAIACFPLPFAGRALPWWGQGGRPA
jgi:hypothetical protein